MGKEMGECKEESADLDDEEVAFNIAGGEDKVCWDRGYQD